MLHDGNVKRICSLKRLNITTFVNKFNNENATDAGSCSPSSLLNGHYNIIIIIQKSYKKYNKISTVRPFRETVEPASCGPLNLRPSATCNRICSFPNISI